MKYVIYLFFILLSACQSYSPKSVEITANIKDNQAEQRILLSFTNDYTFTICLSPGMWPNSAGKLDFAKDRVHIEVGGKIYPIQDFNTGYCPKCTQRVPPGKTIKAYISYEDFELPLELYTAEKKINFYSVGLECENQRD